MSRNPSTPRSRTAAVYRNAQTGELVLHLWIGRTSVLAPFPALLRIFTTIGIAGLFGFYLLAIPDLGVDFTLLHPAAQAIWEGENPYSAAPGFFNPPWALIFLGPLGLLPLQTARWVWFAAGTAGYAIALHRLGIPRWAILGLMASPFIYFDLGIGNLDWLVLLGASLPGAGAWLLTLKPQAGAGLALLWLKQRRWSTLIPLALAGLFLAWITTTGVEVVEAEWNASIWPWGIPVGLWLAARAYRTQDPLEALAAMPFLSPYLALQSWLFALLPLTRRSPAALAAGIALGWIGAGWFLLS